MFYVWNSWLPANVVDYKIVAMNDSTVTGSFSGTSVGASTRLNSDSRSQVGQVFFDSYPALHFFDQNADGSTPRLAVQYRRSGSSGAWTQTEIASYQRGGWFSWPWQAAGLSGAYDLRILRMDAAGAVKSRLFTQVNLSATPSATALVPYAESDIVLGNQPATATSLVFRYRVAGSTGGWISTSFTKRGEGLFGRDFQNDNLLPGVITPTSVADYEYQYDALDSAGQVVNGATGQFRITPNAKQFLSHAGTRAPTVVSFVIEPAEAVKMTLRYRVAGSSGAFSALTLTRASSAEPFKWNASTLTPDTGSASYEYEYRLLDGAGNPVRNPVGEVIVVQGTATVGQVAQQLPQTTWVTTGSVSTANTIVRRQARNAFGEVQRETDGRGHTTTLAYNTLGQLVQKQDPQTDVTGENGVTTRATPLTRYVYDLAGRAVATRDANGYLSTQVWQEGLTQPQLAREFHADGGRVDKAYDVFGNLRSSTDAVGRQTRYRYDKNDQLIRVDHPTRAAGQYLAGQAGWEQYEYDSQGQRIAATTVLGRSRQYYDQAGRVSKTTSIEGRSTSYAYTWDNTITGAGGRQLGGWRKTTTLIGGMLAVEKSDVFGRMTWRQDYGGHAFSYGYNLAGWLMTQSSTLAGQAQQSLAYEYYANGYLKRQTDYVTHLQSNYAYDDNGNRVFEEARRTDDASAVYYSSTTTYDELNRVKQVQDQQYTITTRYDAAGNRRNVHSYYQDGVDGSQATQDLWYLYDPMNRFTVTMGQIKDGRITRGATGKLIAYNKAGERMEAEYTATDGKTQYHERYTYTSDGYLQDMFLATWNGSRFVEQSQPAATRQTDLAGRVLNYTERNADNSIRSNLSREYDRDNRQTKEYDYTQIKNGSPRTDTYGYNADGTLAQIVTSNVDTGLTRRYSYEWWDSAQQKSITLQAVNQSAPGWDKGTSLFTYDANGHLVRATDVMGKRTIQYVTDADGQILYRQEVAARNGVASDWRWFSDSDPSLGGEVVAGDVKRKRHYYYLSGHRIGDVNNEGPEPNGIDYAEALAQSKTAAPTKFAPTAYANFDANYQAINESYPARTGTDYTVQKGDTLQGIAERLWGDRSLWYLIAEANGLAGPESLTEGMRLTIPNKVTNIHNHSGTVGVYDAGAAIGDTSPTLPAPPPPPKNGCGAIGMIIMIAIVVVVSIYTAGAAAGYLGAASTSLGATGTAAIGGAAMSGGGLLAGTGGFVLGSSAATAVASAAIGGAVGSIAGQGFAIAAGMQEHFEWRQVGQSALTAGVASGVGAGLDVMKWLTSGSAWASAGRAALSTGANLLRQEKWSWQSVLASAAGGAAGTLVGQALGNSALGATMGLPGQKMAAGFAGSVVSGWAGPGGKADYISAVGNALGAGIVGAMVEHGQIRTAVENLAKSGSDGVDAGSLQGRIQSVARDPAMSYAQRRDAIVALIGASTPEDVASFSGMDTVIAGEPQEPRGTRFAMFEGDGASAAKVANSGFIQGQQAELGAIRGQIGEVLERLSSSYRNGERIKSEVFADESLLKQALIVTGAGMNSVWSGLKDTAELVWSAAKGASALQLGMAREMLGLTRDVVTGDFDAATRRVAGYGNAFMDAAEGL
ncbi:MAG TPA: LysM peptidoglycan-binding domain-containing protein, partial [Burkholderiaceae bacterium]|nr:LysM peptidoglycan-binding domain-containing protein [Burkholderiaceae bacterium]